MARRGSSGNGNGNGHSNHITSWLEVKELVRNTMERHELLLKENSLTLKEIQIDLAQLKIKAGLFGVVAGTLPLIITYLYKMFAQ